MRLKGLLGLTAAIAAAGSAVLFALPHGGGAKRVGRIVHACPRGQVREMDAQQEERDRVRGEEREREQGIAPGCEARFKPESYADLSRANSSRVSQDTAPFTSVKQGAYQAALAQRAALSRAAIPGSAGNWTPYGTGADITDNT
ncbi:MAG TPA: hypothetical protein VJU79_06850, partial [Candidatus Dormibacteraeota bacterium]|nr:hypothetical protein [Candidatus Dormibacteraeota bacterium]